MISFDKLAVATLLSAASYSAPAAAVYLNPDGLGQALIYPYYTVRSGDGNPFNTYVSVANTDSLGKVVRVRFREGRNAREVGGFNLFLRPGDMWTAAVVADADGAKLITADGSCTEPAFAGAGANELAFSSASYSGTNADGQGDGRDRTREGYLEMIEMASVRAGTPTAAATCAQLRATPSTVPADVVAPRGGLMGTLTLINVASGLDATVNADALASLSTLAFFRPAIDPYPDFDSAEITPASVVTTGGKRYRLGWARGIDAVSSVFMQRFTAAEYILDTNSGSLSDVVFTMPTRRFYRTATTATAPFSYSAADPRCEIAIPVIFDRSARPPTQGGIDFPELPPQPPPPSLCSAASVRPVFNGAQHMRPLLGSEEGIPPGMFKTDVFVATDTFQNGWLLVEYKGAASAAPGLTSLAASGVTDLATGLTIGGAFRLRGLPVTGFVVRTFANGTLTCASTACQGQYASAFPLHPIRSLEAAP